MTRVLQMRTEDDAVRARNEGKDAVARRTIWILEIGGLKVRCLLENQTMFVVQVRTEGSWRREIARGPDALRLLRTIAGTTLASIAVAEAMTAAQR